MSGHNRGGFALGVASGMSYGAANVLARRLARAGLNDASVLSVRFGVAALLLAAVVGLRRQSLRPAPGEWSSALLLGILGYGSVAAFFYAALAHGSAGGVTVVFYAYPALIAIVEILRRRVVASWQVGIGVLGAIVGTCVVASGGGVALTGAGVAYALAASGAFAAYLLISERRLVRTPPAVRAFWTAAGASTFGLARAAAGVGLTIPAREVPFALAAGTATAVAFTLLFLALVRLGPTRTAVVLNVEAAAAVILGAVALGEPLGFGEVAGAALVIAAAVWTTWMVTAPPTPLLP